MREGSLPREALVPFAEVESLLPIEVADYVDFYSSLEHASNAGRIFRPDADPLPPNWRHLPVGYHGRSGHRGGKRHAGRAASRPVPEGRAGPACSAPRSGWTSSSSWLA